MQYCSLFILHRICFVFIMIYNIIYSFSLNLSAMFPFTSEDPAPESKQNRIDSPDALIIPDVDTLLITFFVSSWMPFLTCICKMSNFVAFEAFYATSILCRWFPYCGPSSNKHDIRHIYAPLFHSNCIPSPMEMWTSCGPVASSSLPRFVNECACNYHCELFS